MSSLTSFQRKIIYLVLIVLLLAGLSFLGRPAANVDDPNRRSRGGLLSRIREEHNIASTDLGALDPSGEAIRVATLGFRGVATQMLWIEAERYKKKKDWTNLKATLNQITRLQPHHVAVWQHQGWNLAYNVSVEFDNFNDRYRSVIDGLHYLERGIQYNRHDMRLIWDVGRTTTHKIGRSDERKQFRKLFFADDDYHSELANYHGEIALAIPQRDSWLVGRRWYKMAEKKVESESKTIIRGMEDLLFYNGAPLCRIYYAENLELDGKFDDPAMLLKEWKIAETEWRDFGKRPFETEYIDETVSTDDVKVNVDITLESQDYHNEKIQEGIDAIEALAPGLREELIAAKREKLTDQQREALDTPAAERTQEQMISASEAMRAIRVTHKEVAAKVPRENRKKAIELAFDIRRHERLSRMIGIDRSIVNYDAWLQRTILEQDPDALLAHELIYEGNKAFENNDTPLARENYSKAFELWRNMIDKYPALIEDGNFLFRMNEVIERYEEILGQFDETLPDPFILQDVIDAELQ